MYLQIDVSDEWTTTRTDDGHVHRLGDTSIHALRIRELPASVDHWVQRTALRGAPSGTAWTERAREPLATIDGWEASVRETVLEHEDFQRVRLVAFYRFLDYAAGAIVDVHASWFDAQRDDLLALLATGRPNWGPQDTTCLAALLGGAHHHLVTLK